MLVRRGLQEVRPGLGERRRQNGVAAGAQGGAVDRAQEWLGGNLAAQNHPVPRAQRRRIAGQNRRPTLEDVFCHVIVLSPVDMQPLATFTSESRRLGAISAVPPEIGSAKPSHQDDARE